MLHLEFLSLQAVATRYYLLALQKTENIILLYLVLSGSLSHWSTTNKYLVFKYCLFPMIYLLSLN